MAQCALTTVDNPYDPFIQPEAWYRFDEDNGSNYISETRVDEAVFDGNLSILTLTDGETEIVMRNAELIQQVEYADGWYLCFRELSQQELQYAAFSGKLDYLAMMADIDMEV